VLATVFSVVHVSTLLLPAMSPALGEIYRREVAQPGTCPPSYI
jgi:hypothetical protein